MCDPYNGASAHAWLFEYYFSNNKKAYLFEQMSCGSAGCNLEIQLYSTLEAAKSDIYRREEKLSLKYTLRPSLQDLINKSKVSPF